MRRPTAPIALLVLVAALAAGGPPLGARSDRATPTGEAAYALTDLGTLGGPESSAYGINDAGQVVGVSTASPGQTVERAGRAFLWEAGRMSELGTAAGGEARASEANVAGLAVGAAAAPGQALAAVPRPIAWDDGRPTDLGTLGGPSGWATDVNAAGHIVGFADTPGADQHAFLWEEGWMTDLGTLGGRESRAWGVNDAGQVAGGAQDAAGREHAVLWEGGRVTDLGTLGGPLSRAYGISDAGHVAGVSTTGPGQALERGGRAFLWRDGRMTDLGTAGGETGYALAVNDRGQVVGWAGASGGDQRAVLWHEGRTIDLTAAIPPGSGWKLQAATGINDRGQIVGNGVVGGEERAFLLTPSPAATPEAEGTPSGAAPAAVPAATPVAGVPPGGTPEAAGTGGECWPPEERLPQVNGHPQYAAPPAMRIDPGKRYVATLETNKGTIEVDLFPQDAPFTVNNFVCLARDGFYDGTPVHRIVPGFVIQGGDPTGTGRGGPGYQFDDEPVRREYERGTLAMANAGPDTNGSQFFVVLEDLRGRLPKNYTIFGKVTTGMDVVDAIAAVPVETGLSGERSRPTEPVNLERVTITEAAPTTATPVPAADPASMAPFPPGLAPADCRVAPRRGTERDWLALILGPTPETAFETMVRVLPAPPPLPAGKPADAATREGLLRTARELAACINAGDFARVTALYADDYWRRILPQGLKRSGESPEQTAAGYAALSDRPPAPPPPEERAVSVAVESARILPDGRAGAVFTVAYADGDRYHGFVIFVLVDDRWLIDDRVLFEPGAVEPLEATPPAGAAATPVLNRVEGITPASLSLD